MASYTGIPSFQPITSLASTKTLESDKQEAENFLNIGELTENLNAARIETGLLQGRKIFYKGNSFKTLQELHTNLISLCAALPNTQFSHEEKASCADLHTKIKHIIDVSTKSSESGLKSRIYSLWLRLYNWLNGDSVWLHQIAQDMDTLTNRMNTSAPEDKELEHATKIVCRLAYQNKFSIIGLEHLKFKFTTEDAFSCASLLCKKYNLYFLDAETPSTEKIALPECSWWIKSNKSFSLNPVLCARILGRATPPMA